MDKGAQFILSIAVGMAFIIAAGGWAESRSCVVSKVEIDKALATDIDYSQYDW